MCRFQLTTGFKITRKARAKQQAAGLVGEDVDVDFANRPAEDLPPGAEARGHQEERRMDGAAGGDHDGRAHREAVGRRAHLVELDDDLRVRRVTRGEGWIEGAA